ncbi:1,2-phenylacetyl-CoA monooxygenase, subunit D [Jannaschia seosinensis]|uniref:1,2-phenylacetyl-CoA monooxygenase, subunit D n=2 Tax=Jannaschia seosinensis TaxID=313367 RepID=A0A0M7BAB7_9RHOB|nr:1,2-phenylacetyl-CoA monooxygenase, subunit D [Jannaschia seosinensis]
MVRPAPAPVPGSMSDLSGRPRHDGPPPATEEEVRAILSGVPDPEIPVISVTDLGIVRDVALRDGTCRVAITPTYSGCPATSVISFAIEAALRDAGLEPVIETRIDPPWTTDWLTETGRAKLLAYGIAPPSPAGGPEACPQCGASDLTRISNHGSTPCKAQWRCDACQEPFNYFKCH